MSSSDDYILITHSQNLDEGANDPVHQENESASAKTMSAYGVTVEGEKSKATEPKEDVMTTEPLDTFKKELLDDAGIEIVARGESDPADHA